MIRYYCDRCQQEMLHQTGESLREHRIVEGNLSVIMEVTTTLIDGKCTGLLCRPCIIVLLQKEEER